MTGYINPKSSECPSCFEKWRGVLYLGHGIIHRYAVGFLRVGLFKGEAPEKLGFTLIVERL